MRVSNQPSDFWRSGDYGPQSRGQETRLRDKKYPGKRAGLMRTLRGTRVKIAVLDMETDPFDPVGQGEIRPFLAILYSNEFEPMVMWDEDWTRLMYRVKRNIEELPDRFIIYAHNGGRFDYMFLIHELHGEVMFKGRALMSARIGNHELRDSFHILPEKLQAIGGKDEISYELMARAKRRQNKQKIIDYCLADCRYLLDSVLAFKDKYGTPLTIGQAAMRELKREYDVENLSEYTDNFLRQWFHGGRVECFRYGIVSGDFGLYDVNSMYPFVMAQRMHPIGREFYISDRIRPRRTAFITLSCTNNGALVSRTQDGSLTTSCRHGIFETTIYEYETALRYNLITNCEILRCVDFERWSNFSRFVEPIYAQRLLDKKALDHANTMGDTWRAKQLSYDVLFAKLLLNNAYGKFAQNPRRFKNYWIGTPGEPPPSSEWGFLPEIEHDRYSIYTKPATEFRFNNVATAASITGAARAELLGAIATSKNILYCDTDSIICGDVGNSLVIDPYTLGAWKQEYPIKTFIGNGKKLYAVERSDKEPPNNKIIKAKGINGVTWQDMQKLAGGEKLSKPILAPTLGKDGSQKYITRELRQTGL